MAGKRVWEMSVELSRLDRDREIQFTPPLNLELLSDKIEVILGCFKKWSEALVINGETSHIIFEADPPNVHRSRTDSKRKPGREGSLEETRGEAPSNEFLLG